MQGSGQCSWLAKQHRRCRNRDADPAFVVESARQLVPPPRKGIRRTAKTQIADARDCHEFHGLLHADAERLFRIDMLAARSALLLMA